MAIIQKRSKRKPSGGKYKKLKTRKQYETGSSPVLTKIQDRKMKVKRTPGGNEKHKLLAANTINVMDQKTKKTVKATVKTVSDNPANRHYIRRNILTKGTIVETDKGNVKITSRPGQEGSLNGVLVH